MTVGTLFVLPKGTQTYRRSKNSLHPVGQTPADELAIGLPTDYQNFAPVVLRSGPVWVDLYAIATENIISGAPSETVPIDPAVNRRGVQRVRRSRL